ncbi:Holin [Tsukamurella ocularis]|uniref:phage holin n=1 Tax=Tsukamurella ocularis TaxID=1970234 RepID=UPI0039F0F73E
MHRLPETTNPASLLNIRTWGDVRAFIHSAAPAVAGILLGTSAFTAHTAQIVAAAVALVVAVTDASLAAVNTASGFRRWLYPVLAALGTVLALVGVVTNAQWAIVSAIVPILLGGGVAGANTETTPAEGGENW